MKKQSIQIQRPRVELNRLSVLFLFIMSLLLWGGCEKSQTLSSEAPSAEETLIQRGRMAYQVHCIACHNRTPNWDGALGPAVWGSSLELLEARLLEGKYPNGYTPKRKTRTMVALPHVKDEIPALHAYLNDPNSKK